MKYVDATWDIPTEFLLVKLFKWKMKIDFWMKRNTNTTYMYKCISYIKTNWKCENEKTEKQKVLVFRNTEEEPGKTNSNSQIEVGSSVRPCQRKKRKIHIFRERILKYISWYIVVQLCAQKPFFIFLHLGRIEIKSERFTSHIKWSIWSLLIVKW